MPLVTIVPAIISRITAIMQWNNFDTFWRFYFLVVAAFVPWLSVASPLVTILFVERYRRFIVELFRGSLARIGVASTNNNRMMPPVTTGFQAAQRIT